MSRKKPKLNKKTKKLINELVFKVISIYLIIVIINLQMPQISLAQLIVSQNEPLYYNEILPSEMVNDQKLPEIPLREPMRQVKLYVTAYTSHASQTDGNPCNTAFNINLCNRENEDVVATNYLNLPVGSKLKIPEYFGEKIFTVVDRMNPRFQKTIDVWMKDYNQAIKFGRKFTIVEIY